MPEHISDLSARLQEGGRIRLGDRGGTKGSPRSLSTFRFTSPHERAIRELAAIYGGEPRKWSDKNAASPNQWEVISEASEINVWLKPGGVSQYYELWQGSVCDRRCDGLTVELGSRGPDGEPRTAPCLCDSQSKMVCKPRTRLIVILPEVVFVGGWRLDTSSWHAARSMPSMAEMIEYTQTNGLCTGSLVIKEGKSNIKENGKTKVRRFKYPELVLNNSLAELVSGEVSSPALMSASRESTPALAAGDTDVIEAVLVEEAEEWATKAEAVKAGVANEDLEKVGKVWRRV